MDSCNCIEPQWPADKLLMNYQYNSVFFIALAYFSIPLELIYFVKRSAVFPNRWVLVQFGVFIVLCGATHLINLWTFSMHSRTVVIVLTTTSVLTAVVSCATALMLLHIIPELLSVKMRELFLKNKAAEPDRETGIIRTQEETRWHVRMLTLEIKSTLDSERRWHVHELELIEVVADQVAVALSHAAILKESMRARDHLAEQNVALDLSRREPETAIRACNDFLAIMNHEMRTPMHVIIALYSLLLETELTAEQRLMVETVLKSNNLLATLINDVLDLSRLEDRSLKLDLRSFNLHSVFREVINLIKPIASVKKLFLSLNLAPDLPEYVAGDEKLLMQTILNVSGNAVKFLKEGSISVSVSVAKLESLRDARALNFSPMPSDNHIYLQVQVMDSGSGISSQDIPKLFNKFVDKQSLACKNSCGKGLGLAISKRFLSLMEGYIWIESEGHGKGCTARFLVKLGIAERPK
ncbi:hypothetical protein GIB67_029549 [Kingdonia uniflora]|uniref:histidine kinase n=1 Tax=Kingdonia uniflora TaxID=39325 RepID=A0A7J7NY41_9MAGN|nr:hypothetical protein GIB67_029549 [Kingdonia uniflora]